MNSKVSNELALGGEDVSVLYSTAAINAPSGGGSYGKPLYFPLSSAMNLNSCKKVFFKKTFFGVLIPFSLEVAPASYAAVFPTRLQTLRT